MSKSATWLLLSFVLAAFAFLAQLTIGFWVPIVLIVLGTIAAIIGLVVDLQSRRSV